MAKIQQISTLSGRGAGLLAKIMELYPLFEFAEFRTDTSFFPHVPDKSVFNNSAARAENATAQRDANSPVATGITQALYTRELTVDLLRQLDAKIAGAPGLVNFAMRQLSNLALKIGQEVQDHMLQGTGSNNQMLGLAQFVKDAAAAGQTAALGFTTAEQAAMVVSSGSLQVNTTANENALVELLQSTLFQVPGANAIILNQKAIARLTSIAKRIGALGQTVTEFGTLVNTFNNVPLVPVQASTQPSTETDGTNSDCTSIHVVRFAEEQGVCYSSNSGFYLQDFENAEVQPEGVARLSLHANLVVERNDAYRRITRVRF
jgi:uncharacterized protein YaiE (UPF0345 family)